MRRCAYKVVTTWLHMCNANLKCARCDDSDSELGDVCRWSVIFIFKTWFSCLHCYVSSENTTELIALVTFILPERFGNGVGRKWSELVTLVAFILPERFWNGVGRKWGSWSLWVVLYFQSAFEMAWNENRASWSFWLLYTSTAFLEWRGAKIGRVG